MWIIAAVSVTNLALGFGAAIYLGHGPEWLNRTPAKPKEPEHA
jgi:hypothetical protein